MESPYPCNRRQRFVGRRDFLWELGGGLGGVAFAAMKRLRAQSDADACEQAYYDRWGNAVANFRQGPIEPLQFTGD